MVVDEGERAGCAAQVDEGVRAGCAELMEEAFAVRGGCAALSDPTEELLSWRESDPFLLRLTNGKQGCLSRLRGPVPKDL